MSQPAICPICGSFRITRLAAGEHINPTVNGETNLDATILLFCCASNHIFMTLDDAFMPDKVSDMLAADKAADILRRISRN